MTTSQKSDIRGPSIFLAQGLGKPGWKTLKECATSAAALGYRGMQVPLWEGGPIDTDRAAESKDYCDEQQGIATAAGCPIVEVANHVEGQLVFTGAVYQPLFRGFAPGNLQKANWSEVAQWATARMQSSVKAASNFGFDRVAAFPGTAIFHTMYEWPQRPAGLVNAAFNALAVAWQPVFDTADDEGVDVAFEIHPMEEISCAETFFRFKQHAVDYGRATVLLDLSHQVLAGMQQEHLEDFVRQLKEWIRMFHVKDAEFHPSGKSAAYGGYLPWTERPGRFRSTGDGQIDYLRILNLLKGLGIQGLWATVEWECAFKGWSQGAAEASTCVQAWLDGKEAPATAEPVASDETFDDFVGGGDVDRQLIGSILGIPASDVNVKDHT